MADANSLMGSKLGPRLAGLMSEATVATKRALADTEHQLRVMSARTVVDWMGLELGAVMAPLTDPILKRNVLPPEVQRVMENMTSGRNQWQALAGMAFGASGASSSLGTIMSNYLAPTTYAAVGADPLLVPAVGELSQLVARHVVDHGTASQAAGWQGIDRTWFDALVRASVTWPDLTSMIQLWRQGAVGGGEISDVLRAAGFEDTWAERLLGLARTPLSVSDAALALVRGSIDRGRAEETARLNGVDTNDLQTIIDITGDAPAVEELLGLWRRGAIDEGTLERGIRQSRLRDEWIPVIRRMGVIPPSPGDALDALLKGQTDEATARLRYEQAGGDPTWFQTAFSTAGASPSPVELGTLANRGIIPWNGRGQQVVSFEQGFLEGQWRNKWQRVFRDLAVYLPPPRTVTAMYNEGSLTATEAVDLLQKQGLSQALAQAYVRSGSAQKTAKHRELAVGEVTTLYEDKAIDYPSAERMLGTLGYDANEAGFLLELAELRRLRKFLEQAIGTVHTEYTNYHIDRATASGQLDALQVPSGQRDELLALWDGERRIRSKRLTQAEIRSARKKGVITDAVALAKLVEIGYPPDDAAILLQL
jgi:hypothetical protein